MNIYEEMSKAAMGQMDAIMNEAKKYMLQPQQFDQYLGAFSQGASQIMQLVSNPAIMVRDINGCKRFIVAGEKWKLYNFLLIKPEAEGNIRYTNPITAQFECSPVSKNSVIACLAEYEDVYNSVIEKVMEINALMNKLQTTTLCGDKYKIMEEVIDVLNVALQWTRDYYNVNTITSN